MVIFRSIIKDLTGMGWTQAEIADDVGTTQTNISELLRGREPKYFLGCRLVELHEGECGE